MKNFKFCIVLIFTLICLTSYSQSEGKINEFLEKIEEELKIIDSTTNIVEYRKSISNRNIFVKGIVWKEDKIFKQRIKYYKNGMKKETLKLYKGIISGVLVTNIIKINDKIHFVKHYETFKNKNNRTVKLSKELLIDQKIYQKYIIDKQGYEIGKETVITVSLKK